MTTKTEKWVSELLNEAGITIGGSNPWDIAVHDKSVFSDILRDGSLGLGEAYMAGKWDCPQLDEFFCRVLRAKLNNKVRMIDAPWLNLLKEYVLDGHGRKKSLRAAEHHYNLGNDFYEAMLDKNMQYTCGYWADGATTLDEAQEAKLHLICRKLDLKPGEKVLELGSGWGGLARFAARHYGAEFTCYNVSSEQVRYSQDHSKNLPITYCLEDYRNAKGQYDKVVSVGMCEHVGQRYYRSFLETAHRALKPGGVFLLHTIGSNVFQTGTDRWLETYIFQGAKLPTPGELGRAADGLFVLEDLQNIGVSYDPTLMAWNANFEAAWPRFRDQYGDTFYRMWRYYLLSGAGAIRARDIHLYQLVLSKDGIPGGWKHPSNYR